MRSLSLLLMTTAALLARDDDRLPLPGIDPGQDTPVPAGAPALLAQEADNWPLLRGINPGQNTHVHLFDGKRHSGGFISTTGDNIVIRVRTGDQTFTKDQIKKVSVRKGSKRWRNAAIGAAIGAASIGILFVAQEGGDAGAPFTVGAIAFYGVIGGGIGALFPGYDTIYRAPRK